MAEPYCKICHKLGHYASGCPDRRGWDDSIVSERLYGDDKPGCADISEYGGWDGTDVDLQSGEGISGDGVDRVRAWRALNRGRYNEYMRNYMRRRRGK